LLFQKKIRIFAQKKRKMKRTIASEYVSFGHPDKIADQISDALLDAILLQDSNPRTGIEVMVKDNVVVLGGEINTTAHIDYDSVVRRVFKKFNFSSEHGLSPEKIKIINLIGKQSPEIHNGVDKKGGEIGAGDQGFVVGFATNETEEFLPLGYYIAKKICTYVSKKMEGVGPDAKSQVIVTYDENGNSTIDSILVSTMHGESVSLSYIRENVADAIVCNKVGFSDVVYKKIVDGFSKRLNIMVNPCGEWRMGGPVSDCGLTGRKIVVDQYGGYCNVGGGAFSGKDMTKVDRSAAYMARYLARNIVGSGICNNAKIEISYTIGVPEPSSLNIEMDINREKSEKIKTFILENIDLTPKGIMERFRHSIPRYEHLAEYGHFGNGKNATYYPWEVNDFSEKLKIYLENT
jgi:S-adenosylmethionine synthetase